MSKNGAVHVPPDLSDLTDTGDAALLRRQAVEVEGHRLTSTFAAGITVTISAVSLQSYEIWWLAALLIATLAITIYQTLVILAHPGVREASVRRVIKGQKSGDPAAQLNRDQVIIALRAVTFDRLDMNQAAIKTLSGQKQWQLVFAGATTALAIISLFHAGWTR